MSPSDADTIRERALLALARNRVPGCNFAGHFLDLQCRRFEPGAVAFDLPAGPHCTNAEGNMDPAALSFFTDMVLAAAIRAYVDPAQRTATLVLRYDFTGAPARGPLSAEARSEGFSFRTALPQALAMGSVFAD